MALRHGVMPKTLHVDEPTPHVDWSSGAVRLLTEAREWPETGRPRRAGVSSFGVSGTNAHVILEQAPEPGPVESVGPSEVDRPVLGGLVPWLVSARGEGALRAQAGRLLERLVERPGLGPVDVGFSLVGTRSAFEQRAVVLGGDREELLAGLRSVAEGVPGVGVVSGRAAGDTGTGVVFVFPGQGSQWVGMGRELWEVSSVFAESMVACERALVPFVDWSLRDVVFGGGGDGLWERVDVVQPVLWAVMVSLAAVWRSFGVEPAAVVGIRRVRLRRRVWRGVVVGGWCPGGGGAFASGAGWVVGAGWDGVGGVVGG
ncbi:acyltransferase domain-containing protein [Streptomyces sp. FXJ1.4098]|nr:acyltransferase domain-containing protein [Streptomyces sp. FXJ1.4098]